MTHFPADLTLEKFLYGSLRVMRDFGFPHKTRTILDYQLPFNHRDSFARFTEELPVEHYDPEGGTQTTQYELLTGFGAMRKFTKRKK